MKTKTICDYPLVVGEILRRNMRREMRQFQRREARELRAFKRRNDSWLLIVPGILLGSLAGFIWEWSQGTVTGWSFVYIPLAAASGSILWRFIR